MKIKKSYVIFALIIIIFSIIVIFLMNVKLITPLTVNDNKKYGIIDGGLSEEHKNITPISFKNEKASTKQHGDLMLDFVEKIAPEVSIYYYNAEVNEKISTETIINALQWMVESGVDCVTISLSGKHYSEDLENWIKDNSDKITVYACYSNSLNTFDYPAKYDGVIGVGTENKVIKDKDIDVIYKSNNIVVLSHGIKYYSGNSYLAPYTMLKN